VNKNVESDDEQINGNGVYTQGWYWSKERCKKPYTEKGNDRRDQAGYDDPFARKEDIEKPYPQCDQEERGTILDDREI
jgi:hypothetical protein